MYSKGNKAPRGSKKLTLGSVPDGAPGHIGALGVLMHRPLVYQYPTTTTYSIMASELSKWKQMFMDVYHI
jgi:hypothetical protein